MGKYMNYELSGGQFWRVSDIADSLEEDLAQTMSHDRIHKQYLRKWKKFIKQA